MLEEKLNSNEPKTKSENEQPIITTFDKITTKINKEENNLQILSNNKTTVIQDKISEKLGSIRSYFKNGKNQKE